MTKRAEKRLKQKKKLLLHEQQPSTQEEAKIEQPKSSHKGYFANLYINQYKKLLWIPLILFILAIMQISFQVANSEDHYFINRDISLKGGVSLTFPTNLSVDTVLMQEHLSEQGFTTNVRNIQSSGRTIAFIVESGLDLNDDNAIDNLVSAIGEKFNIVEDDYSTEGVGASIGKSFFKQTMVALLFSFILMAIIVAITFKTFIPSMAVIAAAVADIVITIAIVNIFGMEISTAGLAAFLMLIGYSVDTDILLTTRVLKRKEGTVLMRIFSAFKTGILMNFTTLIAIIIALFITSSDVIRQIMVILLIGILVDQISTWIQNVGILRWYLENKKISKVGLQE